MRKRVIDITHGFLNLDASCQQGKVKWVCWNRKPPRPHSLEWHISTGLMHHGVFLQDGGSKLISASVCLLECIVAQLINCHDREKKNCSF